MDQLLGDIEAFLARNPTFSPTRFGDEALGDRHFVRQLRGGRRVWPETEAKVRAFMAGVEEALPSTTAVAVCSRCDERADGAVALSCTSVHCPMRQAEAA